LELRGFLVRPPYSQSVFLEQIHDAERERIVRANDGEVGFLFLRKREQLRQILRAEIHTLDQRRIFGESFLCDARIARRAPHLRDVRRLRQFPNQRVFASARTDDENFHEILFDRLCGWRGFRKCRRSLWIQQTTRSVWTAPSSAALSCGWDVLEPSVSLQRATAALKPPHSRRFALAGRLRQFPDQRVFASARTDDENFHCRVN